SLGLRKVTADRTDVALGAERGSLDDAAALRRMDEFTLGGRDGDGINALITEEEEITGAWGTLDRATFHGLLISVTIKRHPIETVHQLREAGAIKPVYGRTAPEIRNAEETLRRSHQVARPREAV